MKTVAFVPIKLNSVRLPHKNILLLDNKPLCWHIVSTLLQVNTIDEVYVYCSDASIKQYISTEAIFLIRPEVLNGDFVKGEEIYRSFINQVSADVYILAHATSPFVKQSTIKIALNRVLNSENDSAFTARKIQTFAWYDNSPINYSPDNIPRTQDITPIYVETSAFYIFKKELFIKYNRRIGFNPYIQITDEMESIDIDYQHDYDMAKLWIEVKKNEIK